MTQTKTAAPGAKMLAMIGTFKGVSPQVREIAARIVIGDDGDDLVDWDEADEFNDAYPDDVEAETEVMYEGLRRRWPEATQEQIEEGLSFAAHVAQMMSPGSWESQQ